MGLVWKNLKTSKLLTPFSQPTRMSKLNKFNTSIYWKHQPNTISQKAQSISPSKSTTRSSLKSTSYKLTKTSIILTTLLKPIITSFPSMSSSHFKKTVSNSWKKITFSKPLNSSLRFIKLKRFTFFLNWLQNPLESMKMVTLKYVIINFTLKSTLKWDQ